MKCLENLSLVSDECMESLQKDIKSLIESYVDIEKACNDILDKFEKTESHKPIKEICETISEVSKLEFGGESCFYQNPIFINNIEKLSICYVEMSSCNIIEEYFEEGIWFGKENSEKISNIGKEEYWFYRDGTNWTGFLDTRKGLFRYLRNTVNCFDDENLSILFGKLKDIERKYSK